ncbi:hypothetical protein CPB84DRAFT_1842195 [Gymnopilus junonius]|uniref:Ribosomal RNA methyltransferase FtsJ domain-containing protein n=1 Tax=Gymnopilus junonius TaxID=109634 RepID=A0A9P5NYF5_GYMJU|nr:hypothetical protein CPB84DRAFT_1842195 [Gymnopilus junonius]
MHPPHYLIRPPSFLSSTGDNTDESVRLCKALVGSGALVLRHLLELQEKGWNHEAVEQHFQQQRQTADNASSTLNVIWFERMKAVLREIDQRLRFVPSDKPLKFLDLGCCPGGFLASIMRLLPAFSLILGLINFVLNPILHPQ